MADTDKYRTIKEYNWLLECLRLLGFAVPILITFFIFVGSLNTRIAILEKTVPTSAQMAEAVKVGVSEAMTPIILKLNDHETRLRAMEKQ